jgi:hypothetical protein
MAFGPDQHLGRSHEDVDSIRQAAGQAGADYQIAVGVVEIHRHAVGFWGECVQVLHYANGNNVLFCHG